MKICVLGLGYIGLPTAAMFATHGFEVVGVDVNGRVVDLLNRGEVHIQEEAVHRIVLEALASGRLRVSLTPEKADVFIIAVPTPLGEAESKPERTPVPSSANASGQASRPSGGSRTSLDPWTGRPARPRVRRSLRPRRSDDGRAGGPRSARP